MKAAIKTTCLLTSLVSLAAYGQNEWRDKWREMKYATVNGVEIAYDDVGSGEAILFIPPSSVADSFAPILDESELSSYRLINMHPRGNGQSGDYEGPANTPADALALLEHLGVSKVHVVGFSGGGLAATYMAMTAPEVVQTLVLVEPGVLYLEGMEPLNPREAEDNDTQSNSRADYPPNSWGPFFLRVLMGLGDDWESIIEPVYPHAPEHLNRSRAAAGSRGSILAQVRVSKSDFENIQAPVLFVWSENPTEGIQVNFNYLIEQIPQMDQATAGERHILQVLHPEPLAEVIADYVGQHPIED